MNVRDDITKITMYSTSWCGDCVRARMFFDRFKIDYIEVDIEEQPDAEMVMRQLSGGRRSVPTIHIEYKDNAPADLLIEPDFNELAKTFLL
ncbi:MAG: putative glutaredoxin.1 [candidate division WS6 bacterium OLB20]|uniref:Putative glutaredoxin.1 n=1 Tax=candidate division WS6 bacterium OLB20 TaxID=1617426 RepID=A0A136LZ57_9BACT|nr:MAG: putative glutaredoxin.1 [candidate division WS6 bacterium OLB20]